MYDEIVKALIDELSKNIDNDIFINLKKLTKQNIRKDSIKNIFKE